MFYVSDYMTGKIVSGPFATPEDADADRRGMAIEDDCIILEKLPSGRFVGYVLSTVLLPATAGER